MTDLKPCPFCGSVFIYIDKCEKKHGKAFFYYCENCDARGPWIYAEEVNKEHARQAWNDRK